MTQIQTPRFLMPLLVSIEVDEPDHCQQIGQFLWSPWVIGFGHSYRVDAQGVHALPDPSLVKRVAVIALAILLWPLTLLATVLGNFITASSATQTKAYTQIKNWNIGVAWQNDRPEIRSNQLLLRPIHPEDLPAYQALFNNEHAMRYATGERFDVTEQFHDWSNQWEEHPFSAMAVVDLQSNRVIGHAMLGAGDFEGEERGCASLSILIDPAYRNDGFDEERATEGRDHIGLEVTRMLVTYARALRERGTLVPAYVDAGQNMPAERVHYDATGAVDWVYVPLNLIRTVAHRYDIAARRIGERMAQEVGAVGRQSNVERECFTLALNT
jgi:RimJ/RimL family protein N-acetyltransferase